MCSDCPCCRKNVYVDSASLCSTNSWFCGFSAYVRLHCCTLSCQIQTLDLLSRGCWVWDDRATRYRWRIHPATHDERDFNVKYLLFVRSSFRLIAVDTISNLLALHSYQSSPPLHFQLHRTRFCFSGTRCTYLATLTASALHDKSIGRLSARITRKSIDRD